MAFKSKIKQQPAKTAEEFEASDSSDEMEVDEMGGEDSDENVEEDSDEEAEVNSEPEEDEGSDEEEDSEGDEEQNDEAQIGESSENEIEIGNDGQASPSKNNQTLSLFIHFPYVLPNDNEALEKSVKDLCNTITKVQRVSNRNQHACLVYFENSDDCSNGLKELRSIKINGQNLYVKPGRPKIDFKSFCIVLEKIPAEVKISDVKELFPKALNLSIMHKDEVTAYIWFANHEDTLEASNKKYNLGGCELEATIRPQKKKSLMIPRTKIFNGKNMPYGNRRPFNRNGPQFQNRRQFNFKNQGYTAFSRPHASEAFNKSQADVNENKTITKIVKQTHNDRQSAEQHNGNVQEKNKKALKNKTETSSDKEKTIKEEKKVKTGKDKNQVKEGKVTKVKQTKEDKGAKVKKIKKGLQIGKASGENVSAKTGKVKIK